MVSLYVLIPYEHSRVAGTTVVKEFKLTDQMTLERTLLYDTVLIK
jgi:hypothetical protein